MNNRFLFQVRPLSYISNPLLHHKSPHKPHCISHHSSHYASRYASHGLSRCTSWLRLCLPLILVVLFSASALGEETRVLSEYKVIPFALDEKALISFTFGEEVPAGLKRDTDHNTDPTNPNGTTFISLWDPQNPDPSCTYTTIVACPGGLEIRYEKRSCSAGHDHSHRYNDMTSSGIAKGTLTKKEALQQANAAMEALGLTGYTLNAVWAEGLLGEQFPDKAKYFPPTYKVRFRQTLEGLPLYWADTNAIVIRDYFVELNPNETTIGLCDGGVFDLRAKWSSFEPAGQPQALVPPEAAQEELSRHGIAASEVELCYLLLPADGTYNTATPAYRFQDKFVNALTGARMQ